MRLEYRRFRIALMMFALGLAAVYMIRGLSVAWSEVPVDLPQIASGDVIPVFIDKQQILRRETVCGFDPSSPEARAYCTRKNLFEYRDVAAYEQHEMTCDYSEDEGERGPCPATMRAVRNFIWKHWTHHTRGHVVVKNIFDGHQNDDEDHYFIEQNSFDKWRVVRKYKRDQWFIVNGIDTPFGIVEDNWSPVSEIRWKIATEEDQYAVPPGTRCLSLIDEAGQGSVL